MTAIGLFNFSFNLTADQNKGRGTWLPLSKKDFSPSHLSKPRLSSQIQQISIFQ